MYNPLYVKTDNSLLSSLIKIDDLILYIKNNNISACAIVDDNLFGTMDFYKKCNKNNIKPIIGLEIKINNDTILLYAKDIIGYKNLVKIETIKNEEELTIDILKQYNKNIIGIIVYQKDIKIDIYQSIYDDFYLGVSNKSEEEQALKINKNTVFINKTLYLEKYQYKYLPYIFMIRDGKTISDGIEFVYQNNYLLNSNEISCSITSINNTLKIGDMCNLILETDEVFMPKYETTSSKEYLISLAKKGLSRRLNNNVNETYLNRLKYELDIIIKMNFEDYFLVVYDYIKYAKQNNILVGPGRGSAAGSLVSYSLGITDVDPIKYNLLFERFLNPERITMPDIDTDFPDIDRDKVIDYVVNKYGEKKVAGIITFGTLGAKQAIRDVGRVLNIDTSDIEFIIKRLRFNDSLRLLKKRDMEVSKYIESDDKLKLLYNVVTIIEGNKRHTSVHAAGIVMSYKDLDEIIPIIKNNDMYLTEYSMEYLEEVGLIKMDFLGLKNLTIVSNIIKDLKNESINIDFNNIPLNDKNVLSLFANGDTIGIFQFESEGMKKFLKELKPSSFDDISAAIALFRPGPAENIPTYIKRKNGRERIDYLADKLEPILKDTYGIIVYQEQIIMIANTMASYTYGEADILRRAMSKKKLDILKQEEEHFINNCLKNDYKLETSKKVYDMILKFANYGFNKSHSICYSLIACKMAYLKYHYPKHFYSNLLASVIGSEIKTNEYLMELKKLNIKILPPDVNQSLENKYLVTDEGIRLPLSTIRNVGGVISNLVVEERKNKPYMDIYDFIKRTYKKTNNQKVLESLIYSHALDCFGLNINTLLNNLDSILNYIELTIDLTDNIISTPEITEYKELDVNLILEEEKKLFGFYLSSHKTEKYKALDKTAIDLRDIKNYFNKRINIYVVVEKIKEITTKNNQNMAFITGSDNTSNISITIFPKLYEELKKSDINEGDIIKVVGNVERRFNEYQIVANTLKKED